MKFYIDVLASLPEDSIILTPNRRLAMYLHGLYQRLQKSEGNNCWETPVILPITTWIRELWTQHTRQSFADFPYILNAAQEQQIWESLLAASPYNDYLLQISETARLVKSARGLLKQWQISIDHPLFASANDYQALQYWIQAFESLCEKNNWLDEASIPELVHNEISSQNIAVPANIYYAGFTDLSPQIQALFSIAAQQGANVTAVTADSPPGIIQRTSANDSSEEYRLCAQWAQQQHAQYPDAYIGCVIPNLDSQRDRIAQIFAEEFASAESFNLSAGKPLSHYPVIHAALELLGLYRKNIESEDFFFILSTPFIGGAETERMKRSVYDSKLRAKNFNTIDLAAQLIKAENSHELNLAKSCPILAKRIRDFKALLEDSGKQAVYSSWASNFNQLLTALGWPGERILNSEEYQVVEEWLTLLQEFSTLDLTTKPVSYHEALQTLRAMAATKPFQTKTPAAKVQVLGVLEAAGLCFDQLWVCGMNDMSWPTQPKPNPFIPKQLQRELQMPHASAERELLYCQQMTQQFTQSAGAVTFSYARKMDENPVQPSPLIRDYPEIPMPGLTPNAGMQIYQARKVECIDDQQAPAMMPDETASGGIKIIQNQALCPFKAFAECRLGARDLEKPLPGIRAKERGTIIHHILEHIWKTINTHEKLLELAADDLHQLLEHEIDTALLQHAHAQKQQDSFLMLEKKRLKQLLLDWLEIEKQRPPFAVLSSETQSEVQLGKLKFNIRIDRIDQLADGGKLIIDYKTSANLTLGDWFGDRPEAPQLPLYAQLDPGGTDGITYAQLAAGKLGFKGICRNELDIEGIDPSDKQRSADKKSWQALMTEWQISLTRLADDFHDGKAFVDPKSETSTCQYCNIKPFCRIYEYDGYANDE